MGVRVLGSARIELPLDILSQARDAVCVLPGAWEPETEWQPGGGIRGQGGGYRGVRDLELFKADAAYWIEVRYGVLWKGESVR